MTLVLYPSHGFHIRNLFDSGLVAELAKYFRIAVLTNPGDANYIRSDYGDLVEVHEVTVTTSPVDARLEFVRKRIVVKPDRAVTVSVFSEREKRERPIRYHFLRLLNSVLGRPRLIRETWLKLERKLIPGNEFDTVLRHLKPAAVVAANYGTEPDAIRLLRSSRRLGIATLSIVPSFDNLTSKGAIGARPDKLVVWNETMRREALQLHDFASDQVEVCGGLQFDVYANPRQWETPDLVWRSLGLDPRNPTIVVGTITPAYFPHNIEVVELLAEAIQSGELPRSCQVIVRLHPQVVDGGAYGDDLSAYRRLAQLYPCIGLDIPTTRRWHTMQPPSKGDMLRLATILAHSAAVVLPASTLALDAAAVDTPIIGIAFDGRAGRAMNDSVERMFHFTHYRPIIESGAVTLARSSTEMIAAIREALGNRSGRAAERRALAHRTLGPRDGGATGRVVAVIRRLTE